MTSATPADHDARATGAILALRDVSKLFGTTKAIDQFDLDICAGQVHALLGENGAGKSTVARVAAGVLEPTTGALLLDGEETLLRSVRVAEGQGILLIPQELQLFDPLSAAENLFVGRPRPCTPWGTVNGRRMRAVARRTLAQLGLDIDVRVPVERLFTGDAGSSSPSPAPWFCRCAVLIMDEPTAALDDWEADRLLVIVRELRSAGVAIVYVSHRLGEIRQIADTVTVMRDGRLVATGPIDDFDDGSLVRHMVGRTMEQLTRRTSCAVDRVVLRTARSCRGGGRSRTCRSSCTPVRCSASLD